MEVWAKHASPSGEAAYASTFYAHPLACAGALAALTLLTAADGTENASRDFASALRDELGAAAPSWRVRGEGARAAVEFWTAGTPSRPDPAAAGAAGRFLLERGILALPGGLDGSVLSFLPARSLTTAQRTHALESLRSRSASDRRSS
jgi:4-aminobutyrate aminotransferase-like enzyme